MSGKRYLVGHRGQTLEVIEGRAYLHVSGYALDRVTHPETDADLAERVADWRSRRDTWGTQSVPYDITAFTVAQVAQLFGNAPALTSAAAD